MKKTLFPHQMDAIERMEERESKKHMDHSNYSIDMNLGIYADKTGYGKTVSVLGLIVRDKVLWDLNEEFVHTWITGVYGNGCLVKKNRIRLRKLPSTLIVANPLVLRQWEQELEDTPLCHIWVDNKKKIHQADPNKVDVVLCSPSFLNPLIERFSGFAWKRFVFDEPTHTKIPSMRQVVANYIWLLTSTPELLLQSHRYSCHFINSIFTNYMDYHLYKNLIIKNDEESIQKSFAIPPVSIEYHQTSQKVFDPIKNLFSPIVQEMIQKGNITGAVKAIDATITSDVLGTLCRFRKESLSRFQWKRDHFKNTGDEKNFRIWEARCAHIQQEMAKDKDRLTQWEDPSSRCSICLETKTEPILLMCCQNMFCGKCVLEWLYKNCTCPLCRQNIYTRHIIHYSKDFETLGRQELFYSELPSKSKILLDILTQKPLCKMIVFSPFPESFYTLREFLTHHQISFGEFKGNLSSRERIYTDFKRGCLSVLLLTPSEPATGLNLQETTDIVFYHPVSDSYFTQIKGRAYRIGRKIPLCIHCFQ